MAYPDALGAQLLAEAQRDPVLCDELYVQVAKQLTQAQVGNAAGGAGVGPGASTASDSLKRGCQMFGLLSELTTPSAELLPFLLNFVQKSMTSPVLSHLSDYMNYAKMRLQEVCKQRTCGEVCRVKCR